jgi:multiple sugar transport system substrate-binding protein
MRFRGLAAAAVVALVAIACGSSGGSTPTGSTQLKALDHHVDVNFWHAMAGGLQRPTLEQIADSFNKSQTKVTIHLQVYDNYGTLNTKTLAALAAGTPPDMAQAYENWAAKYQQSNALADLTPLINAQDGLSKTDLQDYFPSLLEDGKLKGKQYMFPFNKSTNVLYYNPDMFAEVGITNPPATWEEFFQDAQKLTKSDGSRWGTDFASAGEGIWESMLLDYGGTLLNKDQTKVAFNSDAGRKSIQMWRDAVANKSAHRVSGYEDEDDFGSKHIGMMVQTIAGYSFIDKSVGTKFKMKTAPVPSGPKGNHVPLYGTNVVVFSKAPQDVQQGAFQFIKYFTNMQNQELWSQKTGYMPVRQSAVKDMQTSYYQTNPNLKVAVDQLPNAFGGPPLAPWNEVITNIVGPALVNIVDGKASAKQGLDEAANKANDLLATG